MYTTASRPTKIFLCGLKKHVQELFNMAAEVAILNMQYGGWGSHLELTAMAKSFV
jgi:hypothetical protein